MFAGRGVRGLAGRGCGGMWRGRGGGRRGRRGDGDGWWRAVVVWVVGEGELVRGLVRWVVGAF